METVNAAVFVMFGVIFIAQIQVGKNFCNILETKSSSGDAPKCFVYRCGKCSRVLGKCGCILCNCCNKWFRKRCSLLEKDKFVKLGQCEEPWFCLECMTNDVRFYALDEKKVQKMFNIPTKKTGKSNRGDPMV